MSVRTEEIDHLVVNSKRMDENIPKDFRSFADGAQLGLLILDGVKIIYANPTFLGFIDISLEEMLGLDLWDLASNDFKASLPEDVVKILKMGPIKGAMDITLAKKNGKKIDLRINGNPVQWSGNTHLQLLLLRTSQKKNAPSKDFKKVSNDTMRSLSTALITFTLLISKPWA